MSAFLHMLTSEADGLTGLPDGQIVARNLAIPGARKRSQIDLWHGSALQSAETSDWRCVENFVNKDEVVFML